MNKNEDRKKISFRQALRWHSADMETPISLFLKMAGKEDGILFESAEVDGRWGRYSILALNMILRIGCENGKLKILSANEQCKPLMDFDGHPFMEGMRQVLRTVEIVAEDASLPAITRALYGYFGFGMAAVFNPSLKKAMSKREGECELGLPATVFVFDHLYNRLCQLSLNTPVDIPQTLPTTDEKVSYDPDAIKCCPGETGYKEYVKDIRAKLNQGEAIQVVPSARFCVPFNGNSLTLYRRMRRLNASPYMFYIRFPDITLFGSSPEVMVSCSNGDLRLSPIAGTRKRGATDKEDAELAEQLKADPKDRAEHVMLVDLGRNDLGRIAAPGTVKLDRYMDVEKFSHVMHLTSSVSAKLGVDKGRKLDALDVLAATFPAGTVSGAPKLRAMEIIRALETLPRGPYAGCIGWIGLGDDVNMDMGITIRSMWIKDNELCWQAGGGIVHDSDPETEWQEVRNKSAIMRLVLDAEANEYVPSDR